MKIGFIGFGEVGFEMSKGYKSERETEIFAYDVMLEHETFGGLIKDRAKTSDVVLKATLQELLPKVDVIIAAVPGDKALETAKTAKTFLPEGSLYVDVSASSPNVKRQIGEELRAKNVDFVDGAMLGPLPVYQHKVPTLISGSGCDRFLNAMSSYNMDLEKVSDIPGDATSIKLIRSIFMKGLPALFVEVLEAASTMRVDHLVLKSLASTMNACSFEDTFNRLVTGSAVHAARRAHEMENVIEMLEGLHIKPTMSQATYDRLSWLAEKDLREKFAGKTPKTWQEVVNAWK